ncbi:hypothetical protein BDN67DRAFT_1014466 [Paxillus ammoniavirescens]|nr:hypothetical protein BDN67DRAFT_1014466 [Paxillus ammoniavirescens]
MSVLPSNNLGILNVDKSTADANDAMCSEEMASNLIPQTITAETTGPLGELLQYCKLFESLVATFTGLLLPGLLFNPPPSDQSGDTPGALDLKASHSFLVHQQSIDKVLELVDAVLSEGSEAKAEKLPVTPSVQVLVPQLVKTSHLYHAFNSLSNRSMPLLASLLVASLLHVLGGLSQHHSNFLLIVLQVVVVSILGKSLGDVEHKVSGPRHLEKKIAQLAADWPADIRTALQVFHIDPELQE